MNFMIMYALIYFVLISLLTILLYYLDKKAACSGAWRVSERTLQFLALAGGSPAAFFAQKKFRHKTKKKSFMLTFWLIVLVQVLAAALFFWKIN